MINVLDSVKTSYRSDSVMKKYFVIFRDYGQMKDNTSMTSESLQITESICSSGNFKVGLCESGNCKLSILLDDNVKGDEITVFQVLGNFEPTITNPPIERDATGNLQISADTEGVQLSGEGLEKLTTTFTSTNIISGLDSNNFSKKDDYLILAKFKYIGNPIYLFVDTPGGNSRCVYYLKAGLYNFSNLQSWDSTKSYSGDEIVLYNDYVWQSRTYDNTIRPDALIDGEPNNAWRNVTRYVQVAIPIIGNEFYEYKMGIYAKSGIETFLENTEREYSIDYGNLVGTASIYKLDYHIMPLGIFSIKSCKRKDDANIRNIESYDRMQDVGLDVDTYLYDANHTNPNDPIYIQLGVVLDQAANTTQIVIGSNLSKEPVNPVLTNGPDGDTLSFNEFPTGDLYEVVKAESQLVKGTYSEKASANCVLDHTRQEQKTLQGTYKNGGAYSHTQMQVIDGVLDETATNSNKEFSCTLYTTMKGDVIYSDSSNWTLYKNAGKVRQIGTRRQTQTKTRTREWVEDGEYVPYGYIWSGTVKSQVSLENWYISNDWVEEQVSVGDYYDGGIIESIDSQEQDYTWSDTSHWSSWSGNISTPSGYYEAEHYGGGDNDDYETKVFYRDTNYGYYYKNLDSSWIVKTAEYYTGVSNTSYVTDSGAAIKQNSYIDLTKTLYWKYTWDVLPAKTSYDTEWATFGNGKIANIASDNVAPNTFQYQSLSSGSAAKYPLSSTRPAKASWYTKAGTIYSSVAVYQKMSRRYTRTHYYDYTFASAGSGFVSYHNAISDTYNNYTTNKDTVQIAASTLSGQYKIGTYSNTTVYNTMSKDYRKTIKYGYIFEAPSGQGWIHPENDYTTAQDNLKYRSNTTSDGITQINDVYATMWRAYQREITYTWQETAILKRMTYRIPDYDATMSYTVYLTYPTDTIAYREEGRVLQLAQDQVQNVTSDDKLYTSSGELIINKQNDIRQAIVNKCTKVAEVSGNGTFNIDWVQSLTYTGYISYDGNVTKEPNNNASGTILSANPFNSCVVHSQAEKFNDMQVKWGSDTIHGTRRSIISGFMELHGMFINFDRWGVSTTRNVKSSTLYPKENLYPHDSTIPGRESYGDIYPSIGSTDTTLVSMCKSLYIDDDLNNEFDGVVIVKSQVKEEEANLYPFYYNRQNKRYGTLAPTMPEISTTPWEGNNYYRIENNFFFDNFIFSRDQLKEICQTILANIGDLQYFNLTAEIRALPYMEVGDSIDIMTPKTGYETAILRRVMKGNLAQMDSIETDFY